jgi:signal transduction histidine kinase
MAEELLYVPFTKVDDLSEGLGLGLPLCKKHITNLGGDFILDEEYQQGCRFIVELPKE